MTDRPILFTGSLVRPTLDGLKTMTRRTNGLEGINDPRVTVIGEPKHVDDYWQVEVKTEAYSPSDIGTFPYNFSCPYGVPGDMLWMKEGWSVPAIFDDLKPSGIDSRAVGTVRYEVDGHRTGRYRSPRFMPRWASRGMLEVTSVRVERLQEISDADIAAEGIVGDIYGEEIGIAPTSDPRSARIYFAELWNALNARRGYP